MNGQRQIDILSFLFYLVLSMHGIGSKYRSLVLKVRKQDTGSEKERREKIQEVRCDRE